jgi:hypothetical protein
VVPGAPLGEVVPGVVVLGVPLGDVDPGIAPGEVEPGVLGVPLGEVEPGVVAPGVPSGEGDPGVVVFGDVPFGEVEPGLVCVPAGGVAVPAGGVAVPAGGVAVPGVAVCPAVPVPAGGEPPDGELCAVTHAAQPRVIESIINFFADITLYLEILNLLSGSAVILIGRQRCVSRVDYAWGVRPSPTAEWDIKRGMTNFRQLWI